MIIRTEAIVLRSMVYGETSQIVTLFTREKGKIAVLAKGARLLKSRFGSSLQPMSYTQVVFYYKPTRQLQTLTESSHVQAFLGIGRHLKKLAFGQRMMELVAALVQDEEQNPQLFNLLLQTLHALDHADDRTSNVLFYFQLRLAAVLGFQPHIDRSAVEALAETGGLLVLDQGAVVSHQDVAPSARPASRAALRAFAIFARAELDAILRMTLPPAVDGEVHDLIEAYFRHHVGTTYPTRSDKVLSQLFG